MSFENLSWVFVCLSLVGNYFVIKKNVLGQWIWLAANLGWIGFDLYLGAYSQAFLFGVYSMMCVYGILEWSKKEPKEAM